MSNRSWLLFVRISSYANHTKLNINVHYASKHAVIREGTAHWMWRDNLITFHWLLRCNFSPVHWLLRINLSKFWKEVQTYLLPYAIIVYVYPSKRDVMVINCTLRNNAKLSLSFFSFSGRLRQIVNFFLLSRSASSSISIAVVGQGAQT